jgi:hypothetical protein
MSHFYDLHGNPRHFVKGTNGKERPSTIADAKKHGWLPSVTEVLKVLDKPALTRWQVRQGVYAVTTAPDLAGEGLDAKIERILDLEAQQDEESKIARDRGSDMHAGLEALSLGKKIDPSLEPWILPAWRASIGTKGIFGVIESVENILVGNGYGGKADLITWEELNRTVWIVDWKCVKNLPKNGAWPEAVIQCASYAAAYLWHLETLPHLCPTVPAVRTANVYLSTVNPGEFYIAAHPDWHDTYKHGFRPLLKYYRWSRGFEVNEPTVDSVQRSPA